MTQLKLVTLIVTAALLYKNFVAGVAIHDSFLLFSDRIFLLINYFILFDVGYLLDWICHSPLPSLLALFGFFIPTPGLFSNRGEVREYMHMIIRCFENKHFHTSIG